MIFVGSEFASFYICTAASHTSVSAIEVDDTYMALLKFFVHSGDFLVKVDLRILESQHLALSDVSNIKTSVCRPR